MSALDIKVEPFWKRGLLMPHPTPLPLRQVIQQRAQRGQTAAEIAEALELVPRSVRHLLRRFRVQGKHALAPSYPGRVQGRGRRQGRLDAARIAGKTWFKRG